MTRRARKEAVASDTQKRSVRSPSEALEDTEIMLYRWTIWYVVAAFLDPSDDVELPVMKNKRGL